MGVDRRMWKMNPERLQEHLQLRNRARQIPDKKKQNNKRACRNNSRRVLPHFPGNCHLNELNFDFTSSKPLHIWAKWTDLDHVKSTLRK